MENNIEVNIRGIKCDNPTCDYEDMTVPFEKYAEYLNKPCPKCESVLLNQEDYDECIMIYQLTHSLNQISTEQLAEMTKNFTEEDTKNSLEILKKLGYDFEITDKTSQDTILICQNIERLPGNSIAPELTLNAEYPLIGKTVCSCGKEHYDVGLRSEYNYISCHDCKEQLRDGDKIHWCHPSRFIVKSI